MQPFFYRTTILTEFLKLSQSVWLPGIFHLCGASSRLEGIRCIRHTSFRIMAGWWGGSGAGTEQGRVFSMLLQINWDKNLEPLIAIFWNEIVWIKVWPNSVGHSSMYSIVTNALLRPLFWLLLDERQNQVRASQAWEGFQYYQDLSHCSPLWGDQEQRNQWLHNAQVQSLRALRKPRSTEVSVCAFVFFSFIWTLLV